MPSKLELEKLGSLGLLAEQKGPSLPPEYWDEGVGRLIRLLERTLSKFGVKLSIPKDQQKVVSTDARLRGSQAKRPWRVPFNGGIILGSLGGLLSGLAISLFYSNELTFSKVLEQRLGLAAVSGLIAGGVLSFSINLGLRLLRGPLYLSVTGGLLGGAVGGVLIMVILGSLYFLTPVSDLQKNLVGEDLVAPISVFIGAAISMCGVPIGIIGPKGRVEWRDILVSILLVMVFVGALVLLDVPLHGTIKKIGDDPNFRKTKIIAWGIIEGAFSGAQVIATLLLYERVSAESE
jgi:hypothetical protein